ncbi:MAG TPA: NAD(P)-dependent oxidoreductase [Stellaceae bacterium]|jgi:UDP-glucose 4-epimerase|nr:NAD(P)-dependent oxidoreductase [Stellaceae bacterium]
MILVTGGLGFIGSHTVAALLRAGHPVVATRFRTGRIPSFLADHKFAVESVDVASPHAVIDVALKHKITGIVHLVVTPLGQLSAAEDYRLNMSGLINVLEAGRLAGVKRISIASSSSIYGGVAEGPFREDMTLRMQGSHPTEAFKKVFEVLGRHYGDRTGIEIVCLRIGNVWGPLYHSMNNLASRLAHAAVKGQPAPLPRPNGRPDFAGDALDAIYVKDCAAGIALVQGAAKLDHSVYNIGSGRATTGADFAAAIKKVVPGTAVALQEGQGPDHRGANPMMDLSRAAALGYRPAFGTDDAMADYVAWLRAGNPF